MKKQGGFQCHIAFKHHTKGRSEAVQRKAGARLDGAWIMSQGLDVAWANNNMAPVSTNGDQITKPKRKARSENMIICKMYALKKWKKTVMKWQKHFQTMLSKYKQKTCIAFFRKKEGAQRKRNACRWWGNYHVTAGAKQVSTFIHICSTRLEGAGSMKQDIWMRIGKIKLSQSSIERERAQREKYWSRCKVEWSKHYGGVYLVWEKITVLIKSDNAIW